jgi:hypothetical protein
VSKRPTPKKRRAKSAGRAQYSEYVRKQTTRLKEHQQSPFSKVADRKNKGDKALKGITRIKA